MEQDCSQKQRELTKLGLKDEDYTGLVYDEQAGERTAGEIASLEDSLEKRRQEEMAAIANEAAAKALKNALQEIKRIGVEHPPSSKGSGEILGSGAGGPTGVVEAGRGKQKDKRTNPRL